MAEFLLNEILFHILFAENLWRQYFLKNSPTYFMAFRWHILLFCQNSNSANIRVTIYIYILVLPFEISSAVVYSAVTVPNSTLEKCSKTFTLSDCTQWLHWTDSMCGQLAIASQ